MNVILGMATNLDRRDVNIFIQSARKHMKAKDTRIVIWVNESDLRKYDKDKFVDVQFIALKGIKLSTSGNKWLNKINRDVKSLFFYNINKLFNPKSKIIQSLKKWTNPAISRFIYFQEYLKEHPEIQMAFLTDVRDVVFQDDIFSRKLKEDMLYAALEPSIVKHNEKVWRWCRTFLPASRLKNISEQDVHCVGTVLGYRAPILEFLNFYTNELSQRKLITWGIDTAIFLDYLYNKLGRTSFVSMNNSEGNLVATTANYIHDYPQLNSTGELFACLHMYDRNPEVLTKVRKIFADNTNE